nr:DUF642 domain-containing protein [uncultured Rhodopila sp.]
MLVTIGSARAQTNLVTNGDFELSTHGSGQIGYNTTVTGWATNGYNFLFASGTADHAGTTGQYGNLQLWGPGNGSANGLPASSPSGGNFIAADGAYDQGAITQSISGLTVGQTYALTFEWAGAQQSGFTGPTTEQWEVKLGGDTRYTPVLDDVSHGFTGWITQTFTFTATAATELLSFLAIGTPSGVPPFSLLDGVSLHATAIPEPSSSLILAAGCAAMAGMRRLRSRSRRAAR